MSTIDVNGTTLYYERRGHGPPVLFIPGAGGDAGDWSTVADAVADEHTVLTYDRRANSRSPRPSGWTAAPVGEQADDAAALLRALDLAPAVAYGLSSGAMILTDLVLRHPTVLRGAILHEPPFTMPDPAVARLQELIGEGMAAGGPPEAMERFRELAVARRGVGHRPRRDPRRARAHDEPPGGCAGGAAADPGQGVKKSRPHRAQPRLQRACNAVPHARHPIEVRRTR